MSAPVEFHGGKVTLYGGDCIETMRSLPENSVDSVAVDPPYHLTSIVKRFGRTSQADETVTSDRARRGADGMARLSRGFMGKQWDGGDIAFRAETWAEVLRVLKPGGHLIAFSGTRTYHRMACAIEDAGFEIRDLIAWLYASGFPKSHDISKALGKSGSDVGGWEGWGTALKPALEPVCFARKPISESSVAANVLRWGTGAIHVDACRIEASADDDIFAKNPHTVNKGANEIYGAFRKDGSAPAYDPKKGRWPANVCHDGSGEVVAAFPETTSGFKSGGAYSRDGGAWQENSAAGMFARGGGDGTSCFADSGSAARFFYSAKADADDRLGSKHPTVKPLDLMRWMVKLITPPGGVVLDCFAGTGTTGHAALLEGFRAILIEREAEYQADITRRMAHVFAPDRERRATIIKAKGKTQDAGPLFSEVAP